MQRIRGLSRSRPPGHSIHGMNKLQELVHKVANHWQISTTSPWHTIPTISVVNHMASHFYVLQTRCHPSTKGVLTATHPVVEVTEELERVARVVAIVVAAVVLDMALQGTPLPWEWVHHTPILWIIMRRIRVYMVETHLVVGQITFLLLLLHLLLLLQWAITLRLLLQIQIRFPTQSVSQIRLIRIMTYREWDMDGHHLL